MMLCQVTVDDPKLPLRKVRAYPVSAALVWRRRVGPVETPDVVRLTEVECVLIVVSLPHCQADFAFVDRGDKMSELYKSQGMLVIGDLEVWAKRQPSYDGQIWSIPMQLCLRGVKEKKAQKKKAQSPGANTS